MGKRHGLTSSVGAQTVLGYPERETILQIYGTCSHAELPVVKL